MKTGTREASPDDRKMFCVVLFFFHAFFSQGKQGVSDVLHMLKEELKIAMIVAGWVLSTY